MEINKRSIGSKYEERASKFLENKGYNIICRNYHAGKKGEIDIIAKDNDNTLVFCEVKYRSGDKYGDPLEAVNFNKQRTISKVAFYYLSRSGLGMDYPCRFDVIAIYEDENIVHLENAFDYIG